MISIAINLDTRPGVDSKISKQGKMLDGTRSFDFLIDGVMNKIDFFKGHDVEVSVYVDIHKNLPPIIRDQIVNMQSDRTIDNLLFVRHTEKYDGEFFPKWNDLNFLNAIAMTRGDYIVHLDGDMAMYINDLGVVEEWLSWLDAGEYDFISYPSQYSPDPITDPDFDYRWASTRFFICKRHMFKYDEIIKCLRDSDYLYSKYGDRKRRCPWFEHIISLINGPANVFYPPIEPDRYLIFAWSRYYPGVFEKLRDRPYEKIVEYISHISYPCDVSAKEI